MMLTRWTPWHEMAAARSRLANFFDDTTYGNGWADDSLALSQWNPVVDIYDDDNSIVITAELPGVGKENISIDVKNRVLTLKGERSDEREVKEEKFYRKERVYGKFQRAFSLPDMVDPDTIRADFKDGVLKIDIPKAEQAKPKQITVQ